MLFLKLDFSSFTFQDLDILQLLPIHGWIYILILTCLGFIYFIYGDGRSAISYVVVVFFALNILYFLAQYPSLAHWDYYMHGKTANQMLERGIVPSNGGIYFNYPGTFLLISALALILNVDVLEAELLLFAIFQITTLLAIYMLFPKKMDLKLKAAGILLTSCFVLMFYRHFCPANYAFVLFLLIAKQAFRNYESKNRANIFLILILSFLIIVSHPLTSIFLLSFFAVLTIADLMHRPLMYGRNSLRLVMMSIMTIFLSWHVYIALNPLQESLTYLYDNLVSRQRVAAVMEHINVPITSWLTTAQPVTLAVTFYKWSVYTMLVFAGMIFAWKEHHYLSTRLLRFFGLGVLLAGTLFIILPTPWIERIILPLLVVAILLIMQGLKESGRKIRPRYLMLIPMLLIPSFLAAHPPFQVYSFHPFEYDMFVHQWEIRTLSFLNITRQKSPQFIFASDLQTTIIYSYFDPKSRNNYVSCGANFTAVTRMNPIVYEGNYIIRSQRQETTSFSAQNLNREFWQELDQKLNNLPYVSKIYDSKYSSIYFTPPKYVG
jgi:hypothetical protein